MAKNDNSKKQATRSTSNKKVDYPYKKANNNVDKKKKSSNSKGKKIEKPKKKKSLIGRLFKWTFLTCFFIGLTAFVIGLGYVFAIIKSTPPLDISAVKTLSEPSSVYDRDNQFMDNLNTEINRNIISFEEMPQYLKDAYVSIEDQRFYEHDGIDVKRILGSAVTDIKKLLKMTISL